MALATLPAGLDAVSELLLTIDGAAGAYKCSKCTIERLVATGELESVKVGRLRRIPRQALVDYVERLRAAAANERLAS